MAGGAPGWALWQLVVFTESAIAWWDAHLALMHKIGASSKLVLRSNDGMRHVVLCWLLGEHLRTELNSRSATMVFNAV